MLNLFLLFWGKDLGAMKHTRPLYRFMKKILKATVFKVIHSLFQEYIVLLLSQIEPL